MGDGRRRCPGVGRVRYWASQPVGVRAVIFWRTERGPCMSEATGRTEMERRLVGRSLEDEAFRRRLLEDPKAVAEQELGMRLPRAVRMVAVEETADTIYLVLPAVSPVAEDGGLSDRELEAVAGGGWGSVETEWCTGPDC